MTDFETHPAGTAARIAELESANGVHIFRVLSKQEMVEVEKMSADGKFQEAAQKFGGQVTYHQDQLDLPPITDAELALHLRGRLVPMSVAYRAASRIEQLVATVEQLEAELTRATQNNDMMFVKGMRHGQQVMKDTRRLVIVDSPELVELREALTRANAATAAAYEVAAMEAELWDGNILAYKIRAIPAIDPAAIREAALYELAEIARGDGPLDEEAILALIGKANSMIGEKK